MRVGGGTDIFAEVNWRGVDVLQGGGVVDFRCQQDEVGEFLVSGRGGQRFGIGLRGIGWMGVVVIVLVEELSTLRRRDLLMLFGVA